jgi:hypothetical protein
MPRSKIETITAYKTTDGKSFAQPQDAELHQDAIDARQRILSQLKNAVLVDAQIEDISGDIDLCFETATDRYRLSIGGAGGDGTTHTIFNLERLK